MIQCQYEQEPCDDEDVLCQPNGDDKEDLYDDEDLPNKDMEDPVISDRFSRDIIKDYFSMPFNTTVEILNKNT